MLFIVSLLLFIFLAVLEFKKVEHMSVKRLKL